MDQETSLKRRRDSVSSDDEREYKIVRTFKDPAEQPDLKRSHPSSEEPDERGFKKLRPDKANFLSPLSSVVQLLQPGQLTPPEVPSLTYDNFVIQNPVLATLEGDGSLVPMVLQATGPASPPSPKTNLLSPDPTPGEKDVDPFSKTQNAPTLVPSDPSAKPHNVVLTGDIQLFALMPARIEIYREITKAHPWAEIVRPSTEHFSLGSLIPSMKGSPLDAIVVDKPQFCYSEESFDPMQTAGLHFEADIFFQGTLQPVSDALRDLFGQEKPALHLSAFLSCYRDWDDPITLGSIILQGSLEKTHAKVFDILEFTRIGVELIADSDTDHILGKTEWTFGYGFFGSVNVTVPGSIVPLQADYHIRSLANRYSLSLVLRDDEWVNVFGVHGLNLSSVRLTAILSTLSSKTDLSFSVDALMNWHETTVSVTGTYSNEHYALEAFIGNLTLHDLGLLFQEITDTELDIFDHDVVFNSMYLGISSEGLTLSGSITVNGHSSANGLISISRDGVYISGGVEDMSFEGFDIHSAQLDIFIGSKSEKSCGRATKFAIAGDVSFAGIDLKVGIFTEKADDGTDLKWAVYGEAQGDLSTSRLCPDLKGTFLDVSLNGLALVAANHTPSQCSYNTRNYPIGKGVFMCAMIDNIPELESLMRGSIKGTILKAGYTNGAFALSLILPGQRTIRFGDNVYTGPLALEIQTGDDIHLVLKALLNVELSTQPEPLCFDLGLKANMTGASAYGQMLTDWVNPCDLGKQVTIRGCALDFGIVYSTFFTTGMPGAIGLAGQINVGSKEAKVAMKLSQNPKEQLLAASIKDLGVVDLVKFASLIAEQEFPEPDNFLHFNDVDLYISTGATVGVTYYPPGASLKGDMTIFGKQAKFECSVGKRIKLMATIQAFDIGPLSVKGATQPDPIVDLELSAEKQLFFIDGAVSIWGASAALHLEANVYPSPTFDLWIDLRLSDLFLLKLRAKLTGDFNFKDFNTLQNANFEVYGLMEQHVIEHILQQLEQQIDSAQQAVKHGFDDVKAKLDEQEAAFKAGCDAAIAELEAARKVWHEKRDRVQGSFDSAKSDASRTTEELKRKVDEAERDFKAFVAQAQRELDDARHTASVAIQGAQSGLNEAQRDSDNSIRDAQNELQRTRDDFHRSFGSAQGDLQSARRDVENAQREVDNLDWEQRRLNREIDDAPWYECPGLAAQKAGIGIAQGTAMASLEVVRGILMAAEAIVQGADFVTAEGAIGAAELALDGVREVKNAALEVARSTLDEVKDAQNGLVQAAIEALEAAQKASDELRVFDFAKGALDEGERIAQRAIDLAREAVDALAACAEFMAFDVAEKGLAFARDNTSELNLARHAVELAEGAVNLGLDVGKWAATHAGKLVDIRKIEFQGSLSSLIADGPPLKTTIEGVLLGEDFSIHIEWQPHFNLVEFIKELFSKLWEMIQEAATDLFKAIN